MSFGFLVVNVCNRGEHYETPCIIYLRTTLHITDPEIFTNRSKIKN